MVAIFAPDGRSVLNKKMERLTETYSISGLAQGMYIVRLSLDGKIITRKLIVSL
jgi:hypothetical protein